MRGPLGCAVETGDTRQPDQACGDIKRPVACLLAVAEGQTAQNHPVKRHEDRAEQQQKRLQCVHGQDHRQTRAEDGNCQTPLADRHRRHQRMRGDRARIDIAIGIVQFVKQDQAECQQAALGQQQGVDQIGIGFRQAGHDNAEAIAPDIGNGIADPCAAHGRDARAAEAGIIGHQRQPRHRHGNHQIQSGQQAHSAGARTVPESLCILRHHFAEELPAQPDQRGDHQRQAEAVHKAAHQCQHRARHQQAEDCAPDQRGQHHCQRAFGWQVEHLCADRRGAVAHHHQLERGPADQLHDVEHNRQTGKTAAIDAVDQARARQAGIGAQFGSPGQQARADHRAEHNGQQSIFRSHDGHKIGAHLDHQQADPEAEPQRDMRQAA